MFIESNPPIRSQQADLKWAGIRIATAAEPQLGINWVTVGDPGNADDPADGDHTKPGVQNFGAVDDAFRISRGEVTNAQYADFLNAVDVDGINPHGIYSNSMGSDDYGGILLDSGSPSGSKYRVRTNKGNMPVNFVTWFSAARFANWMNNGEGAASTETGAYDMSMALPVRLEGATVFLPSEAEWYKAAYYDPRSSAAGGPPGDDNYWVFPTQSDTEPVAERAPGGATSANLSSVSDGLVDGSAYLNTKSYYGVFDLAGNVWEWNEAIVDGAFGEEVRSVRGGGWSTGPNDSRSGLRPDTGPTLARNSIGFRLASVVLIGDMNTDGKVDTLDIEGFVLALTSPAGFTELTGLDPTVGDINADGSLNAFDIDPFVSLLAADSPESTAQILGEIASLLASDKPFRILGVTKRSGGIEIEWSSVLGSTYNVEYSELLSPAGWEPLNQNGILATGSSTLFVDAHRAEGGGYYRVVQQKTP